MTQFGRALHALNIDIICANSSQAKGRVERAQGRQARDDLYHANAPQFTRALANFSPIYDRPGMDPRTDVTIFARTHNSKCYL